MSPISYRLQNGFLKKQMILETRVPIQASLRFYKKRRVTNNSISFADNSHYSGLFQDLMIIECADERLKESLYQDEQLAKAVLFIMVFAEAYHCFLEELGIEPGHLWITYKTKKLFDENRVQALITHLEDSINEITKALSAYTFI